ncbi:hypothetical protein JB92DRAFT_3098089, partial [Gautieria morchelliformis]
MMLNYKTLLREYDRRRAHSQPTPYRAPVVNKVLFYLVVLITRAVVCLRRSSCRRMKPNGNVLSGFVFGLKTQLGDQEGLGEVKDMTRWIDANGQSATADELEEKLSAIVTPTTSNLYADGAGPGEEDEKLTEDDRTTNYIGYYDLGLRCNKRLGTMGGCTYQPLPFPASLFPPHYCTPGPTPTQPRTWGGRRGVAGGHRTMNYRGYYDFLPCSICGRPVRFMVKIEIVGT